MPKFGKLSKSRLETCHADLQIILNDVIGVFDIAVLQGYRTEEEHQRYLQEGRTKVPYHKSKHSSNPSLAIDVAPYPINWGDVEKFRFMGGLILGAAAARGIPLRWGGDWDGDGDFKDQTFDDLVHFELRG